mgnify:CR=1 FL=1
MALDAKQISQLLKLRALGWSQEEIAEILETSQQVVAYQLKKLKKMSASQGVDQVFNSAIIGGITGAALGIGAFALLNELFNQGERES